MSAEDPRLLKKLLAEIYLLLLALLTFINFFVPAMIHSVYTAEGVTAQDRLWVRIVPATGNAWQESLGVGAEVGLAVAEESAPNAALDCFRREPGGKSFAVAWWPPGRATPLTITHDGQPLALAAWVAAAPPPATAAEVLAPLRLVVYHERDEVAVDEEIRRGALGANRLTLELTPANRFQQERPLPPELLPTAPATRQGVAQ